MRLPKQLLSRQAQEEHITVTIKKATELYVVGGVAYDPTVQKHMFWYAIRKYPPMSSALRRETGTRSKSEYIQEHRPEWTEGTEPPEGYEDFYRNMPSVFEEGSPRQIEKADPAKLGRSVTIVEPTQIEYGVEATGNAETDVPVVEQIIKEIRQLIWQYPVQGDFTSIRGLQGKELQQFIGSHLKRAHKAMRLQKFAQSFTIIPEATRYIDVATGTIFTSEDAVQQAIEDYHAEPAPMAAAASKGGTYMNSIGELLKIADMLDERGKFDEADEIVAIITEMSGKEEETPSQDQTEDKKAWARRAITTIVRVADSLESKGATKEAQMADQLLVDFQQALPQGFSFGPPQTEAPVTEAPVAVEEAPASDTITVEDAPFSQLEDATVVEEPVTEEKAPEAEAAPEEPVAESPTEVSVEEPSEPEPSYDEVTIDEFKEMIEGLRWRHSQGPKRQKYEEILQGVEQAKTYFDAYKEWLEHAHKKFEDEPIRIKID